MFFIGIPSYKRVEEQLTLEYLKNMGYTKDEIVISTQTAEDRDCYIKRYGEYATIIYREGDCVGDNRNTILKYLPKSCNVLFLDDDIKHLSILEAGKLRPIKERTEFDKIINNAFDSCFKMGARIWGVYPVENEYFMKRTIDKKNILIGCVLGLKNEMLFDRTYRTKEDYELCCREMMLGNNCVRYNFLTAKAKHKTNSGGCKDDWKFEINKECADKLIKSFPSLIKRNSKKPDEVRYIGK